MLKNADLMEFCNFLKIADKINNGGWETDRFCLLLPEMGTDENFWGWSGFRICAKFA